MVRRHRSKPQRREEYFGGGDGVLHRQIDADRAHGRQRMGGIADAQQAGPIPARQSVDGHAEQLDVVPADERLDPVAASPFMVAERGVRAAPY
jgi:hypothetical protein